VIPVVIDTNVVVSGILFGGLPKRVIEAAIEGRLAPVVSAPILFEYREVFQRFDLAAANAGAELMLDRFLSACKLTNAPPVAHPLSRDRDDDKFIECAIGCPPPLPIIVSGDSDLLVLQGNSGLRVLPPRAVLALLAQPGPA
jgi:putative PIN family toxin of toxin-antitoxin system